MPLVRELWDRRELPVLRVFKVLLVYLALQGSPARLVLKEQQVFPFQEQQALLAQE